MLKLTRKKPTAYGGDLVACFVCENGKQPPVCEIAAAQPQIDRAFSAGDFEGKEGQTLLFYPTSDMTGQHLQTRRVLVVGLGKLEGEKKIDPRETFRKGGGTVAKTALGTRASKIMVAVPETIGFDIAEITECLAEGLLMGSYQFRKYINSSNEDQLDKAGHLDEICLYASATAPAKRGMNKGRVAAAACCSARDMANEPGNVWTPTSFATCGRSLAKKYGFGCRILAKSDMQRLGMGGILGVSSGSAQPPKMVILEYHSSKNAPTLLLVGKGLTFDAGGISIKPSNGMEEMKYDMCGGAAVMTAMAAIGQEQPKGINVVAIVPAAENLPGPEALKPGDIITHYGGKTVEVVNTDAEGRLLLADGLAYGIKKYKPAAVIDLATLTGAVVVALGHHRTGLLSNDDQLARQVEEAGQRCGEPLWRLPLGPEYRKQIQSKVADIKNVGDRAAGTITAATYLQEFVGETPWVHLDIAGTAWNFTEKSYVPAGPSGIGVRTLIELVRNWK